MNSLAKRLVHDFGISDADASVILPYFTPFTVRKNELLLAAGLVNRYLYFINRGCVRSFFVTQQGTEATRNIFIENQFCLVINSFTAQQPATENLQALESTEGVGICHADFVTLLATLPAWERFYRIKLERAKIRDNQRLESFIGMNARQRYHQLMSHQPHLIQRLSNRVLASYLGITQESLSRLKRMP